MTNRQQIITELRDWAVITGKPLPYAAEVIADLEERGLCVDLADGSVSWAAEWLDSRVQLAPAGRAAYAALCGEDDSATLTAEEKERDNLNRLREEVAGLRIGQQYLARIVAQLFNREGREVAA